METNVLHDKIAHLMLSVLTKQRRMVKTKDDYKKNGVWMDTAKSLSDAGIVLSF